MSIVAKNSCKTCWLVIVLTGLASASMHAQEPPAPGGPAIHPETTGAQAASDSPDKSAEIMQWADAAGGITTASASLTGGPVVSLDGTRQFTYGFSLNGGWDSNPADLNGGPSAGVLFATAYLAVMGTVGHAQYLLQYAPTFTAYTSSSYPGGAYHVASAKLLGALNERWLWTVEANGTYGTDTLRILSPTNTTVVGQVIAVNPNLGTFQPQAGAELFLNSSGTLNYRKSERDSLLFQVGETHSHLAGVSDDDFMSTRITYSRRLSPVLRMSTFGQVLIDSAFASCPSVGGGISAELRTTENTRLELSAGPQFQAGNCAGSGPFFNLAFNSKLSDVSQLYAVSSRQFTSGYFGAASWQNRVGGGYQRKIGDVGLLSGDVTYTENTANAQIDGHRGLFVTASYGRKSLRGLSPTFSYRHLLNSTSSITLDRDVAMLSLTWQSSPLSQSR